MKVLTSGQGYQQGPQGIDPFTILNKNQNELQEYYKRREKTLRGYSLPKEAHNRAIAQMQQEYDEGKFKFTSTKLQLDDIKQGMASGQIDPINGQRAMMELVAPQGTVAAMFPRPATVGVGGVSPAGMESYVKRFDTLRDGMLEYGDKKWWRVDKKQANAEKMVKRFFTERNIANLNDPRNAAKIPGFNQAFVQSMQGDERTAELVEKLLDPKTGDPRMLAAFSLDSSVNRGFMGKFGTTKGGPTQTQPITPFANALKPKTSLTKKLAIGALGVNPLVGMATHRWMTSKRKALENRLPSVSTDEDYDELPSGTQFTDPDGKVRTKP